MESILSNLFGTLHGRDEITRKFVAIIFIFVVISLCLLGLARFQANVLSAVRAYVNGEGLYSKSQKDAVHHLQLYVSTHNEIEYQLFTQALAVPLGDHRARLALQSNPPDKEAARAGFLAGRNDIDDVERLISFFLNYQTIPDVEEAIRIWNAADTHILRLDELGKALHQEITSPNPDPTVIQANIAQVLITNDDIAKLEDKFSATLGHAARRTDTLTGLAMAVAALVLLCIGIILSRRILLGIRETHAQLLASEARFRHVVESNIIGIFFWRTGGTIVESNDAFLNLVGYERSDLGKINWRSMTPPQFLEKDDAVSNQVHEAGSVVPYEKIFIRKDGTHIETLIGVAAFDASAQNGFCFVLDLSEQRRLQAQVEQAQKMEAIGTLVGGIAHDFNNTLSAMLGNIQLARYERQDTSAVDLRLDNLEALSKHSARIVHELMTFARKDVTRMGPVSLNRFMEHVSEMTKAAMPRHVDCQFEFCQEPMEVIADTNLLEQVMAHLLNNARDALQGTKAPVTRCTLQRIEPDTDNVPWNPGPNRPFARITFRDNGCGMPTDVLNRVFEPFFTTKDVSQSNGLGMAMAYGAIQSHNGEILVESTEGVGTTITIDLPLVESKTDRKPQPPSRKKDTSASDNSITILLVDDNDQLRRVFTDFLSANDFNVFAAEDGVAALECFEAHADDIALVITDVVMPRMGGIKLVEQLEQIRPELPIIFMTGYDPEHALPARMAASRPTLVKPFVYRDLLEQIKAALPNPTHT